MTVSTFNLIDEPWIQVLTTEGDVETVGLASALSESHHFQRLAGDLPTQDFAVLRVLLAVLYRSLDPTPFPTTLEAWHSWWSLDRLPEQPICDYLERWRDRFDLLHTERPFFQVADLRTTSGEWKSLERLVPDCPGPGALFRRRDPCAPLPLGDAARWLVHCMAYDRSGIKSGAVDDDRVKDGKGYPMGTGWCGWLGGHAVQGQTLRETLLLNLVMDRRLDERDIPLWEEEQYLSSAARDSASVGPFGQVGLLTWPQRRIRLRVDGGMATQVLVCNGDPVDHTRQAQNELMTGWRYSVPQSKKAGSTVYMPRELSPGRALWRGIESLLPTPSPRMIKGNSGPVAGALPSGVLNWVAGLQGLGLLGSDFLIHLQAVGIEYVTKEKRSVVKTAMDDRLTLRAALMDLGTGPLQAAAIDAVRAAEAATHAAITLAEDLTVAAGGGRESSGGAVEAAVYDRLDPEFRRWLLGLTSDVDPEAHLHEWVEIVRRLLTTVGQELVLAAPPSAWTGRTDGARVISVGQADAWFRHALSTALPRPPADRSAHAIPLDHESESAR